MDLYNDPAVREVWVMKSAQVGWTEAINNVIGYVIDRKPGPMMIMQPTVEMVEAWSKDRLAPMLEDSPSLREKVSQPRTKDGANTLRHKTGPGWRLSMAGANSAAGLRMRSVRDLFCDEIDAYPVNTGKDGDPIAQARKRQTTFWNRKLFAGSTPTVKGGSRIEQGFEATDMRFLHVPCPHCTKKNAGSPDGFQRLVWANIKWEDSDPRSAAYLCKHCGELIEHHHKEWMIQHRKWVATKPFDGRAGIHIWEAYSPFVTWGEMVVEFLEAKKLPDTLQTWVNTCLGETWEEKGETPNAEGLLARRESYTSETLPPGVLLVTMGTDVQDDRLESTIFGWGAEEECWRLGQVILRGDPGGSALWAEHDEILRRRFPTDDGRTLVIEACAVDSGGHFTEHVYAYCHKRKRNRVWAIKGKEGVGRLIWPKTSTRTKTRAQVWIIGVDTVKDLIYQRLNKVKAPGPGYMHFDADTTQDWLDQLTSEVATHKLVQGRKVRQFKPKSSGIKQEGLDTTVYAHAAMVSRGGGALLMARAKALSRNRPPPIEQPPPASEVSEEPTPAAAAPLANAPSQEDASAATAAPAPQKPQRKKLVRRPSWAGTWRK